MTLLIIILSFINSKSMVVLTTSFMEAGYKSDSILSPPYPPHYGDTFYVGPDGDNSYSKSEVQSYNTPWLTIQKAMDEVNPGDMVIVKDGIYRGSGTYLVYCDYGGTVDNWVILKAENLYGAKLDGENNARAYGLSFNPEAPYIFVEGLEIYGCKNGGIWFHNGCHDYYLYKNKIHDICMEPSTSSSGKPGIMIKKTCKNVTIDGNIIYNIGRTPHDPPNDLDFKNDQGIYAQGYNIKIQNNIIYNCHAGFCLKIDGNEFGYSGFTHIITNNTFAFASNPHRPGHIRVYKNPGLTYPPRALIQNCIFYEPPMPPDSNGQRHCIELRANETVIVVKNCLTTVDSIFDMDGYNKDSSEVIDCITNTYPNFVDVSMLDFHIQENSACIDNAIDEHTPEYDFDMYERPQGIGYDIGAYEYYEGSSSLPDEESVAYELNIPSIINNELAINYSVPRREYVNISLYDMLGRKTTVLVDGVRNSGYYSVFKKVDIASGTYFIVMKTQMFTTTKKFIYLSNISMNYNYLPKVIN